MGSRAELDYVVVGRAGEVLVSARGVEVFPHATAPTGAAPLLLGSHLARHPKVRCSRGRAGLRVLTSRVSEQATRFACESTLPSICLGRVRW